MPKRTDIGSILVLGAGPIVIGQACEFDYSGAQACKALKAEGYRVILVNSNPATIMTDPDLANATYVEPLTLEMVERIIDKERPDALLPTLGGQSALNLAMELMRKGVLERYGMEMIGANPDVIQKAESRQCFREAMERIGLESPRGQVVRSVDEALAAVDWIGLPAIVRPSFTLGGEGGGIAGTRAELVEAVKRGLAFSPIGEVLVEESLLGWKEYEMEVVRDHADNCIIVCSIENVDPMGIHTGDSMTVAPALTLTDKEYQRLRDASIACLGEIGVDTGGSNVQFAINPETGRMVIIEMNPRVSRSSALASKATGFPIAKIAAKLAVGYRLDELKNEITKITPASFEPTIDYIVTKLPRFAFEKFRGTEAVLNTSMKSVGEAMAIGRSFKESLQKALRSLETGLTGLDEVEIAGARRTDGSVDQERVCQALSRRAPDIVLRIAEAFRLGLSVDAVHQACRVDHWFLRQIADLVAMEEDVRRHGLPGDRDAFAGLKRAGFSDMRLAKLAGLSVAAVKQHREQRSVHPVFKRVDTCAAEFRSLAPYLYSTYEHELDDGASCEADPSERDKVLILGGGPNRIGQGIEFDYCCVHAAYALSEAGYETIMVNCNPETVSTDYDTSDRLYFEPLTAEDIIEIARKEGSRGRLRGAIVQFGGQTPVKLAAELEQAGIPILGTPPDVIDLAEDRERFRQFLRQIRLKQPANGTANTVEEAEVVAERIGYPVLLRPSYVLGGRAMQVVEDVDALRQYMVEAARVSGPNPVLVDQFLDGAIECDVDAVSDGVDVYVAALMQQVEEAGVHSGDSACVLPPYSLSSAVEAELRRQTRLLARGLGVVGLMNVQYAIRGDDIYVLEVNPRASRTVPFVAKATSVPVAKIAARVIAGEQLASFGLAEPRLRHVAVKEAVLPFARFPGSDVVLGPEMKSTGESMGIDRDFASAYLKAQLGAWVTPPRSGNVLLSVRDADKPAAVDVARRLAHLGFRLLATRGTADFLRGDGLPVTIVAKCEEGTPNVVDLIDRGEIQLLIDISLGAEDLAGGQLLRTRALQRRVPYCTRLSNARAMVDAIERQQRWDPAVHSLQSYAQPDSRLKLFVRQPLTQSGDESRTIVEGVLKIVDEIGRNGVPFDYLTGDTALSDSTFREHFEESQGRPFNAVNFRRYRLGQLRHADAFLCIRTAMSESGAFEIAYNVFAEPRAPMFFAVWKHCPIKTTLLRDLEEECDVTYREFEDPEELRGDLQHFFHRVADQRMKAAATPLDQALGMAIPAGGREIARSARQGAESSRQGSAPITARTIERTDDTGEIAEQLAEAAQTLADVMSLTHVVARKRAGNSGKRKHRDQQYGDGGGKSTASRPAGLLGSAEIPSDQSDQDFEMSYLDLRVLR
jgi:carbamoyl-phosphate synthase large subunit